MSNLQRLCIEYGVSVGPVNPSKLMAQNKLLPYLDGLDDLTMPRPSGPGELQRRTQEILAHPAFDRTVQDVGILTSSVTR